MLMSLPIPREQDMLQKGKWIVAHTDSDTEYEADVAMFVADIQRGDREVTDYDTDEEFTVQQIGHMTYEQVRALAEGEMGDSWNYGFVYDEPKCIGADRDSARLFDTEDEARAVVAAQFPDDDGEWEFIQID